MFKRLLMAAFALILALGIVGCGKDNNNEPEQPEPTPPVQQENDGQNEEPEAPAAKYDDGIYYAENPGFRNDWKYNVTITVSGGEITDVEWNGANIEGGKDKITLSADGEYKMVEFGDAVAEWHEQAELVEKYLLESQDPTDVNIDAEGNTDDIAGVTMGVSDFFDLAQEALNKGPIAKGDFKDGYYYAIADEAGDEFHNFVHVAVRNGTIVGVDLNAIIVDQEEGGPQDKYHLAESGEYGMKDAGSELEWHEQVQKVAEQIIETQDPSAIALDDEGVADDIAGVSITVSYFLDLVEKALADAK